ncbi:MAG: aminodeoxychorismate synthase component I [Gammaproteobacteria bacterium]|nr:aminodeoxychorismate synthase component I [Gammaproteobacteria bacterium]
MNYAEEIAYPGDSATLFAVVAQTAWSFFLDSCYTPLQQQREGCPLTISPASRYDIIVTSPQTTLVTRHGQTTVTDIATGEVRTSRSNPFSLVAQQLQQLAKPKVDELPFYGGAVGYFGYDLARYLERLPSVARDDAILPEMAIGIYPAALLVDHLTQRAFVVGSDAAARQQLLARLQQAVPHYPDFSLLSPAVAEISQADYLAAVTKIKSYIYAGDCYQVNYAQRFSAAVRGDDWWLYRYLRQINPAPYSAYLRLPQGALLSASPEQFLSLHRGRVVTRPIKGTAPRSADSETDQQLAAQLCQSVKDRAENVMIVDLLRNDLGRSCHTGSVTLEQLCELQSFAQVHHLVSTISAEIAADLSALDLLQNAFPGGSITGAPKIRAMEIIEQLEPTRRSAYCGSIAYIGVNGSMESNIAIRTLLREGDIVRYWVGGGIVADSEPLAEYAESLHKGAALQQALRHFLVS